MRIMMLAFGRSACRTLCAALLTIIMIVGGDAAELREESRFGSNSGNLRMFSYLPPDLAPGAPLVVVLQVASRRRSRPRRRGEKRKRNGLKVSKKFKLSSEERYAALLLGGAMVFVWGGTVWVLLVELVRRF
jgi:hypothetical protein